tara:strand:- start:9718 stop:11061 length:1344 start_codon:yes stop_codon:yes gene_type:complete
MANQNSASEPANILQFQINSNSGEGVDISAGVAEFSYYESVLSNHITATVVMVETGNTKGGAIDGLLDNLPIRGGERVDIKIEDNYNNTLSFTNGLYVNRVRNAIPGTQKDVYFLDLASREYFANDQVRVVKRYQQAPISTHVSAILKNVLKTDTKLDVDTTSMNYNFFGNDRKPYYVCTWLASKSVPQVSASGGSGGNTLNGAAGYLFYQTREAIHFKSIDGLFKQTSIKKYSYSNTTGVPTGYDASIINYTIDTDIDLGQNLTLGTYSNRTIFYDPVSFNYEVRKYNISDQKNKITTAGKQEEESGNLISKNFTQSPSRLMSSVLDIGYNPPGTTSEDQLKAWKAAPTAKNYDGPGTMVQSIMRYNQLFTIQTNVTIKGDFSIKAGDVIRCDFPQVRGNTGTNKDINKKTSGDYLVAHVCHRVTPSETFTSLGLIRDSYGIKNNK